MWKLFENVNRKNKWLLIILILLIVVRLSFLSLFHHSCYLCAATVGQGEIAANIPEGRFIYLGGYSEASRRQEETGKLVDLESVMPDENPTYTPFVGNMPGYGMLLSAFWLVFSKKLYIYIQVFQILLDILAFLAFYYISMQLFGRKTANVSGIIYALFFPAAYLTVVAFRDIFPFFAGIFSAYLLLRVMEDGSLDRAKYYLLVGIISGIFTWLREISAAIPIFFGIAILIKYGKKEWIKATVIMAVGVAILIVPWTLRNYVVFHQFIPLSTEMGHGWIAGFGEYENPWGIEYDDGQAFEYVLGKGHDVEFLSPEHDRAAKIEAISLIRQEPVLYIKDVFRRFLRGIFLQPNPKSTAFTSTSRFHGVIETGLFAFSIISILSAAHIILRKKTGIHYAFLLVAPALYFSMAYAPFNMGLRHALAGVWGYYILFSYGLIRVLGWMKAKKK